MWILVFLFAMMGSQAFAGTYDRFYCSADEFGQEVKIEFGVLDWDRLNPLQNTSRDAPIWIEPSTSGFTSLNAQGGNLNLTSDYLILHGKTDESQTRLVLTKASDYRYGWITHLKGESSLRTRLECTHWTFKHAGGGP